MKWIAGAEKSKTVETVCIFCYLYDFMLIIQQLTYCKRAIRLKQKMREPRLKQSKGVLVHTYTNDNKCH